MSEKFDHKSIEKKWGKRWLEDRIFYPSNMTKAKKKFYNLWMFPYPSAEGLHAGHAFASTGSDIYGRYKRMHGFEVFQPIGYDSFGIHSENFALKIKEHPKTMLDRTTKNYAIQLQSLGHGYDWSRTVTTSDIDYYHWTQWVFIEMFKAGLAYRKKAIVNWCPSCKTVLADEQVMTPKQAGKEAKDVNGNMVQGQDLFVCERCGTVVAKRDLEQWFFRIKEYADRLLDNLNKIDWPEKIKIAQTNWIGKSEGITITYPVKDSQETVAVWTSRPDTNFGATFIVLAPEHPQAMQLATNENKDKVSEYIRESLNKSKEERIADGQEKTGVFTGSYAVNQLNNRELPIWVTDFVLAEVGTGAVVGVPGHDLRDFQFATKFNLPVVRVVEGKDGTRTEITREDQVQEEEGIMVNSDFLNGLDMGNAISKMMDHLEEKSWGERQSNYHLRDWLISRQRYWGPPIPMIFCKICAKAGRSWFNQNAEDRPPKAIRTDQSDWEPEGWWPEENIPVELPYLKDYQPEGTGRGPLATHPEFYKTTCPVCKGEAVRETDVSDTFLDSAWYFLRYSSVGSENSAKKAFDPQITQKWLPVDLYFGGAEHAVLHLMYARFVTMVMYDLGFVDFEEPFPRFFAHGLMIKDGAKMSKSKGNVVNPDEYIDKFGADTLRLYLMFMGPMDGYPDFRDTGIEGMRRFVDRVWDLFSSHSEVAIGNKSDALKVLSMTHKTIKKVTEDVEGFRYNTAIASLMEFVNLLRDQAQKYSKREINNYKCAEWREALMTLVQLMAPFAPYMAEEAWELLGQEFSVHHSVWPMYRPELVNEERINVIVQVNGKLRDTLKISTQKASDKETVIKLARQSQQVEKWLEGKEVKKEIFVPGKLVNFVV